MKDLAAEGKAHNGINIYDIKQIIPVSVEMTAMMERPRRDLLMDS